MKDYLERERAKRDALAGYYDDWYVRSKGALFDLRERSAFVRAAALAVGRRSSPTVLDLGCGTGRIAAALEARSGWLAGSDLSTESLRHLRATTAVVTADARRQPFRSGSFDLIASCGVLPRMGPSDVRGTLAECRRVLAADGHVIFNAYNDRYWRSRSLVTSQARPEEARRFSVDAVRREAGDAGFDVCRVSRYKALPFRRLNGRVWLAVDRAACSLPLLGARLSAFTLYTLRKR